MTIKMPLLREVCTYLQILEHIESTPQSLTPHDRKVKAQLEALEQLLIEQGET